jgi:hypothetical protein
LIVAFPEPLGAKTPVAEIVPPVADQATPEL